MMLGLELCVYGGEIIGMEGMVAGCCGYAYGGMFDTWCLGMRGRDEEGGRRADDVMLARLSQIRGFKVRFGLNEGFVSIKECHQCWLTP